VADSSTKALRSLVSIDRSLAALSGLLRPARMSLEEKLVGLAAYERWADGRFAPRDDGALVSTTEAAELLGVSRQRVLQLVTSGQLPATKVGDTWVLPRAAVAARAAARG
jgi:excisionase family DNA binding protein